MLSYHVWSVCGELIEVKLDLWLHLALVMVLHVGRQVHFGKPIVGLHSHNGGLKLAHFILLGPNQLLVDLVSDLLVSQRLCRICRVRQT